ncbi:FecR family protein [Sphingobacterium zeae]|uniref:FecR family protein n=1 Tax=Sphingobacterium zeae TaxID=1776859 RepID=UPI00361801A9
MEEHSITEELTIVPLLTKYVRGEELTALEQKTIEIWLEKSSSNRLFFEELSDKERVAMELLRFGAADSINLSELHRLHGKLKKSHRHLKRVIIWTTAAAVLLFLSVTFLVYKYKQDNDLAKQAVTMATSDIDPGKDQATLTFGDGQVISLDGKAVKTDADGVTYVDGKTVSQGSVQYATLSTPRKGQYKTLLPDGTVVWLNSASKLKYPTRFNGDQRLVELQGEGYFEVAHDRSKPFIVVSGGQKVKVLGTKFNINSYANEPAVLTTLVSGSVELSSNAGGVAVRLKPGEQGQMLNSGFKVSAVDVESYTAWTSNEFQFTGTPLMEVLRQLERWYDVDVDYKNVPDKKVYGTISRDKKLQSVLYALGEITDLKFNATGRRIEIRK